MLFVINFVRRPWITPYLTSENEGDERWLSDAVCANACLHGPDVGPYATLCSSFSPSDLCTAMS